MKSSLILIPVLLLASCASEQGKQHPASAKSETHYQLTPVAQGGVTTDLTLPAQLAAYEEISVFPKVNGYVKDVLVDIGSHVSKGQLLMTLDAPELEQAVLQMKEQYTKALSDYEISRENYERLLQAAQTAGAVSSLDLSAAKAKMSAASSLCNAAKANWQMQEDLLSYLRITAPFDGVITERNVHPGALVSAAAHDKPMLELKQVRRLRLQVDVPEAIAARLKENDSIRFVVPALGNRQMAGVVSRRSDNISAQFRAERIEADVFNDGSLASGMYAEVMLHASGNAKAFNVPGSAVVTTTQGKYVIAVRAGKTQRVPVATGNESAGLAEVTGALQPGDQVIVNASDEMGDGVTVKP